MIDYVDSKAVYCTVLILSYDLYVIQHDDLISLFSITLASSSDEYETIVSPRARLSSGLPLRTMDWVSRVQNVSQT